MGDLSSDTEASPSSEASNEPDTLSKTMKPHWVFAMAIGSAVGWGAFILPFDWLQSGGLAGTLIGFAIGALMITVIAANYGLIIRALPVTGGGLAFALAAMGRGHGFIAGWSLALGYMSVVALNASAVALVFRVTLPDLSMQGRLYTLAGWDVYLPEVIIASVFLVVFAFVNVRGMEASGRFQFYAVAILTSAVVLIAIAAIIHLIMVRPQLSPAFPSDVSMHVAILSIVAIVPWAYVGFDTVPQLAGEFNFSPKKALALLMWGVTAATFLYMAMTVATAISVGVNEEDYTDLAWPPAIAVMEMIGPIGMALMVIAVSMGVLTGLNGFYASAARVLLTMGRAHMLPPLAARVHPTSGAPTTAVWFVLAFCMITPWLGRAALSWIVDMTSLGITVAYLYTCICTFKVARNGKVFGMDKRLIPNRLHAVIALAGIVLSTVFIALLLVPGSPGQLGREPFIALILWIVLGVAFYFSRRRAMKELDDDALRSAVFQNPHA